ncbi:MAG: ADP-heptose synthase, bifunctional sugar kinase/adenylyltransferase [Bacteroidetes bacterium]|jgi:rfaE bifunctional protein kinase chain/domain|nr:ADP-heptose synthase, bifunctional sugar kinase/adenylyltransferase [Bacteroidota bacterium]MDF2450669.1 ADP-heptose synthase, bifunctional sugar kinase/adenylyltransferase [Bacteroidota bacterium]
MKKLSVKKEHIREIFKSFNNLNVLIIGDVMIDSYMWGKVNRISPEAPVPIISVNKKEKRLGGAANVALNIQAMGANPILCSVIGIDYEGQAFMDLLKAQKLSQKGILKSRDRITTEKTRVIGNNHQLLRIDEEIEEDIAPAETQQLITLISYIIQHDKIDVILFEDYNKGLITPKLISKVVELAKSKGIPTCVDPKKKNFNAYKGVTLFKPNLKELREGLKLDISSDNINELQRAISSFRVKQKFDTALVTLAEKGVLINSRSEKNHTPAHIRSIADVSGAGDTVISVAALLVALHVNPIVMAAISNLAGGLVCEQIGVVPVKKEQLLEEALKLEFVR